MADTGTSSTNKAVSFGRHMEREMADMKTKAGMLQTKPAPAAGAELSHHPHASRTTAAGTVPRGWRTGDDAFTSAPRCPP